MADAQGLTLVAVGAGGVATLNAWLWRRDRRRATALAAALSEPPPALTRTPRVSVLVAAWNEAPVVERHLRSVARLDYPDLEYLLCAGGNDGTYQQARTAAAARLPSRVRVAVREQVPAEGKQRALRRLLAEAQGEVVVLTDADSELTTSGLLRLLAPLVNESDAAASGTFRPWQEQEQAPLVAMAAAARIYADGASPRYAGGICGANAAITRRALEVSGSFAADALTGTDYVLAKALLAAGFRIRQVPSSYVRTRFQADRASYLRQQGRWVRNLIGHGAHRRAWGDVRDGLRSACTGAVMLALPLAALAQPRVRAVLLAAWTLLATHAVCSRARYLAFAQVAAGLRPAPSAWAWLVPLTLLDFYAWARAPWDLLSARRRWRW